VTSEDRVKAAHPKAEARYNTGYKYWGIFLDGGPRVASINPDGSANWSSPFAIGDSRSNAWVNARKKLITTSPTGVAESRSEGEQK